MHEDENVTASSVTCPICADGLMTFGTRRRDIEILVCRHCGTTLSVPRPRMRRSERAAAEWPPAAVPRIE